MSGQVRRLKRAPQRDGWKRIGTAALIISMGVFGQPTVSPAQLLYTITSETPIDLVFDDISDFQNGVSSGPRTITIVALLTLINNKTVVVGTASNLINGPATVPAGVVRVTSLSSEWTNHSNFLNPAAPQTVTSGITLFPVLTGRTYNLLYQVPANPALLNKPDGVYTTQLGYEFSGLLGNTASVTLNVHIQNVLGITAGGNPSFTIDQEEEFANGIILNQTGGLTVDATQDYDIHVSASGPFSSGTQTIPVNHLRIAVLNAGGTITGAVPLSASGSQLVNEGAAALQKGLNLRYELEGGPHLLNLPSGSYSTTLVYTISAD